MRDPRSDEHLMEAYVGGDMGAFDELFRRYARPMVMMLRERGAHEEDARELVQQGFLQLHRARDRYERGRRLRPWLVTIVFNLQRDDLRRARRWRETPLEGDVVAEPAGDPIEHRRTVARVRDALAALPKKQRTLIELHWFEELTYPQIALRVGATPAAVKLRAHRAHAALRDVLEAAA